MSVVKTTAPAKGFDASKYATAKLPVDTVQKVKQVFDVFDYDGSGHVSTDELVNTVRALGIEGQAKQILAVVNGSGVNGEMDFPTFLEIFGFSADSNSETSLQQVFEEFDKEGKGMFGALEFQRVAASVGEHFSAAQVDQIIEFGDKDRDGGINFQEFVATVTKIYPKV